MKSAPAQPQETAENSPATKGTPCRILVPVDFSPPSKKAVKTAVALAARFGAQLALVYAIDGPDQPGEAPAASLRNTNDSLPGLAMNKLKAFAAAEVPSDLPVTLQIKAGAAAHASVTKAAAEWSADLIVIPARSTAWLRHVMLGTTAMRVVRHAPCPILVIRGLEKSSEKEFNGDQLGTILAPTDFSENALAALPHAIQWAREFGAKIVLSHVVPETLPSDLTDLGMAMKHDNRMREAATKSLNELREKYIPSDQLFETNVVTGVPVHEIIQDAHRTAADIIIMASHGRTGLKHFWIGSVTERMVQHAPCAVLVVRKSPCHTDHATQSSLL